MKFTSGIGTTSLLAGVAAVIAIAATPSATADTADGGTVALPPGGPVAIYPQNQITSGANLYTPFGTDPEVPYGASTR